MAQDLVMGIDVGGQSSKLGVVNANGEILAQCVVSSLQTELKDYLKDLTDAIKDLIAKTADQGTVKGIGIGAPNGNYYKGTIEYAPNLKWTYIDGQPTVIEFAKLISGEVGLPVTVTNDANAAAMGEMAYGTAKGMKNFIMITLGTGVGSGIVIDGKMVYGHDGFAGELGHVCVVPGGRKCNCGLEGCLETYTSAMGVARTARHMLAEDKRDSLLRQLDPEKISSKDVYDAAKEGDEMALEIFNYTGSLLGRAFADFVKFSAPEAIVIFGGMAKSKEYFHGALVKSMNDNLMKIWKNKIQILYSSLKESDAAILGASALAWD
ncbi:MAG: ROK family protein [Bacteroidaceae bacterium]|nr:ROK family protein [Bacteroidaceae bacterium]